MIIIAFCDALHHICLVSKRSSFPFNFPFSSALKNSLFKFLINRKEIVINDICTNLTHQYRMQKKRRENKGRQQNAPERGPNSIFIRKPITTAGNKIPLVNPLSSPQRRTEEQILPKFHSISRVRNLNSIYHGGPPSNPLYIIRPALRVSAAWRGYIDLRDPIARGRAIDRWSDKNV